MAYEKQEWNCGDTITADKMNHIEDGIENAQNGYECTEESTVLTDETVTTVHPQDAPDGVNFASLSYTGLITADSIRVTFDGQEYICTNQSNTEGEGEYGAPRDIDTGTFDWSEYPFRIVSYADTTTISNIFTESAGTYTVQIELVNLVAEVSDCFKTAVKEASKSNILWVTDLNDKLDKTWDEINNAILSGTKVIIRGSASSGNSVTDTDYEVLNTYRTYEAMSEALDPTAEVGVVTTKGTYKASSKSGTLMILAQ